MSSIAGKLCAVFEKQTSPLSNPPFSSSSSSLSQQLQKQGHFSMQDLRTSTELQLTPPPSPLADEEEQSRRSRFTQTSLARYLVPEDTSQVNEYDRVHPKLETRLQNLPTCCPTKPSPSPTCSKCEYFFNRHPALCFLSSGLKRRRMFVTIMAALAFAGCTVLRFQRRSTGSWTADEDADSKSEELRIKQLSEFEQALTVRTDCEWVVGSVDNGAFAFKVKFHSFCEIP